MKLMILSNTVICDQFCFLLNALLIVSVLWEKFCIKKSSLITRLIHKTNTYCEEKVILELIDINSG